MNKRRNVYLTYCYSFAAWFGITNLWVIYLGQKGLPLVQIGLCESIFHVASFCFEVPSGMLADRFSYKTVLYLSRLLAIASSLLMLLGHSFLWFAVSFIISAWSYNLQSGTLEAFAYESLPQSGRDTAYPKVVSMMGIITEVGSTAGVIIAGALVHWHFELTYYAAIVLGLMALLVIGFMDEPAVHSKREERQTLGEITKAAISVLATKPGLRNLMLIDASISTMGTAFYYYFQNVMTTEHFAGWLISGLMLASSVLAIIAMKIMPTLQARFTQGPLLLTATGIVIGALLLSGIKQLPLMLIMYLVVEAVIAMLDPLFNAYYNVLIPSGQRATLLSVASMLFSIEMVVVFPVCGWFVSAIGFNATFAGLGVALLIGMFAGHSFIKRSRA
ncbi:MFS transporter [Lacticaseibacillus zhaodongensis]|uniref:MFS transporter n=1 Tax=Lacticaseibacillus zhaodongensis TaxID=2668065 RepID=UPI0012D2DCE2|nr:MFS transporter [Lacticaseibacillus zhaodongensis]